MATDYFKQVEKKEAQNKPILAAFEKSLQEAGLTKKTIYNHMVNVEFFATYLTYYEPIRRLDQAKAEDVYSFLASWYPHKTTWASPYNTKSYMTSFRKFFKFLKENKYVKEEVEKDVRQTLKEGKETFLQAVQFDEEAYW